MSSAAMSSECTRVVCACPSPSLDVCMSACVWCVRARCTRCLSVCSVHARVMLESLSVRGASSEFIVCVAAQFPCGAWRVCSRHGSPRSSRRAPCSAAKAFKLCSRSVVGYQRWRRGRLQRFGRGGIGAPLLGLRFGLGSAAAALLALIVRCATFVWRATRRARAKLRLVCASHGSERQRGDCCGKQSCLYVRGSTVLQYQPQSGVRPVSALVTCVRL